MSTNLLKFPIRGLSIIYSLKISIRQQITKTLTTEIVKCIINFDVEP